MIQIIEFIIAFCGSFFIVLYLLLCMDSIGVTVVFSKKVRWSSFLLYSLVSTCLSFLGNRLLNLAILILALGLSYLLIHRGKLYFLFDATLLIALYLTDIFLTLGLTSIFQNNTFFSTQTFLHPVLFYLMTVVCIRSLEMMVLKTLSFFMKKNLQKELMLRHFFMSLIFPVFTIFNLFSMLILLEVFPSSAHILLFLINVFLFLLFHLFFIYFLHTMGKNSYLQNELSLLKKQQEIQTNYYTNLEHKYDRTRQLRHDMRNHIQVLEQLNLLKSESDLDNFALDTTLSAEYLKHMQSALNELSMQYYTNNKMLNIILNDKVRQMQSLSIQSKIRIDDIDLSFIRPMDITTIFANLLDNAIEAAKNCEAAMISLSITANHSFISITLKNSIKATPLLHHSELISRKPHHKGLGMKNITQIVDSYHGDLQYEWSDTYFITRILLNT